MRGPHQVVLRPLLTEKGTRLKEEGNQYLFRVAKTANIANYVSESAYTEDVHYAAYQDFQGVRAAHPFLV